MLFFAVESSNAMHACVPEAGSSLLLLALGLLALFVWWRVRRR
ncbi:MAG TPA: PEP-CTERM sorting domain-containing protein [Vicinamibacterales bacterium]|nr:PEP-CTERM sorting domain-containing protein [Vicinamibacterales bacterium]HPW19574.1 PEP-CTERM sorting domain-containing protein [Vicinamibacterales bacterium]